MSKKEVISIDRLDRTYQTTLELLCQSHLDYTERLSDLEAQKKELEVERSQITAQIDAICTETNTSDSRILGDGWYTYLKAGGSHLDRTKLLQAGVTTDQLAIGTVKHKSSRVVSRFGEDKENNNEG